MYSNKRIKQEQEANAFAMALLMPENFIKDELAKLEFKQKSEQEIVSIMAQKFEVSETAMRARLFELGYLSII